MDVILICGYGRMAMLPLPCVSLQVSGELKTLKWQQPRTKTDMTVTLERKRSSKCDCLSGCFRLISKSYGSSLTLSKEVRSRMMIYYLPGYVHCYLQRWSCKVVFGSCCWIVSLGTTEVDCGNDSFLTLSGNEIHYLLPSLLGARKQFMLNLPDSPADTVFYLLSLHLTSLSHDMKQRASPSSCVSRRKSRLC